MKGKEQKKQHPLELVMPTLKIMVTAVTLLAPSDMVHISVFAPV